MDVVSPYVLDDHKGILMVDFSRDEICDAIFSIYQDKSPGPDGMNLAFYQRYWDIVSGDVISACLGYLNNINLPPNLNDTTLVLIPKKINPQLETNLRPIAL